MRLLLIIGDTGFNLISTLGQHYSRVADPFPFIARRRERGLAHCHRASRSVSVNWFEVSRQPTSKQPGCWGG